MSAVRTATVRTRLAGLLATTALIGIVVGLPVALSSLGANPLPPHLPSWFEVRSALTSPDDGTLALRAVTVIAWTAWMFLTGSVLLEVVSRIRGITTPKLPGLRLPQVTAQALVSTALMLFLTAPLLVNGGPTASAQPPTPHPDHTTSSSITTRPTPAGSTQTGTAVRVPDDGDTAGSRTPPRVSQHSSTVPYTVQRGDSLWSIAADHLGSGTHYLEIAQLNADVLRGRPGFLTPGTVLRLPAPTSAGNGRGQEVRQVMVRPGDTLSEIAEEELGDADRYPEIFDASKSVTQPGGVHLSDPDVIDVGWTLTIPGPAPHTTQKAPPPHAADRANRPPTQQLGGRPTTDHTSPTPRLAPVPSTKPGSAQPTREPSTSASQAPTTGAATPEPTAETVQAETVAPVWLLTGLTGGGAVLAGSMLILLRSRRRSQFRNRRPGRTIAVPEPALTPVEKTVSVIGGTAEPTVEFVDAVLRRLAARQTAAWRAMPKVAAVELTRTALRLHLSEPFDMREPWRASADKLRWTVTSDIDLDQLGAGAVDQPAPYPLLVSVGATEAGDVWLLNCEQLGAVSITGDPIFAHDFARYLAAELACNPWSNSVTVDCLGVADEVAIMNPERLRIHAGQTGSAEHPVTEAVAEAAAMLDRTVEGDTDVVTARAQQVGADAWPARLLLVNVADREPASLEKLLRLVADHPGRTGTAVVLTGESNPPRGVVLCVDQHGRVSLPHAQLDLVAVGLTSDEALGCAALLAQVYNFDDVEIPERPAVEGWRAYANEAGALRGEHTFPRNTSPEELPEPAESMLAGDDREYVHSAATTEEDLAVLAPQVPVRVRSTITDGDPALDADVTAWHDPDCDLPRLTLLGPVGARTRGTAIAKRKPYYTELLAYLAIRPHGATPEEVADAFSISGPRVRNDIKILRDWLGTNPRTGRRHLPDARDSAAAQARGIGVYQVEGLLTDADLFRRLRVRGESRGVDGIADLIAALKLVTGQPFDRLRPGGWAWLFDGDRLDQHMMCAIVDVAHLVATHSLKERDLPVARFAAEIAALAAPYEEIPRLDLAAVAAAEGKHRESAKILRDGICNRSDDGLAPTELPARTEQILTNRNLLTGDKARR